MVSIVAIFFIVIIIVTIYNNVLNIRVSRDGRIHNINCTSMTDKHKAINIILVTARHHTINALLAVHDNISEHANLEWAIGPKRKICDDCLQVCRSLIGMGAVVSIDSIYRALYFRHSSALIKLLVGNFHGDKDQLIIKLSSIHNFNPQLVEELYVNDFINKELSQTTED